MGTCISTASSGIYDIEHGPENVVYYQETGKTGDGIDRNGSLHSQQGSKGLNQDCGIIYQGYGMEHGTFCGVFDGHGANGHVVSKLVRNRLPSLLLNQMNNIMKYDTTSYDKKDFEKWKEACVSAFRVMDKEVKLLENVDCACSGTTAVTVTKQGDDLLIANLGDSRAVLGKMVEAERIRACNGRVLALKDESHVQRVWLPHEDSPGLAMSRAFGDFMLKNHGVISTPEVTCHRLTFSDQFLVLATDGVWDVLSNNEVVSIIWAAKSEDAAKAVVDAATAAWEHKYPTSRRDDCTVICLFFHSLHHNTESQTQPS
ncbi:probable protein phosphatase 2C 72 isoform X2 [Daucus carota subsp. sativus]|uniref:probable protein phosphatase 2C 72 isoform X2 n=1 Tax=Daucus carota subsp. sativus TaxID=79200 RepID=UPI0030831743